MRLRMPSAGTIALLALLLVMLAGGVHDVVRMTAARIAAQAAADAAAAAGAEALRTGGDAEAAARAKAADGSAGGPAADRLQVTVEEGQRVRVRVSREVPTLIAWMAGRPMRVTAEAAAAR